MIDGPVTVMVAPAGDVIALDLWDGSDPRDALAGIRHIRVEPRRWWLFDAADRADAVAAQVGDAGALAAIGGGLMRATLTGPGWRALLTIGGLFDSEHAGFGPGGPGTWRARCISPQAMRRHSSSCGRTRSAPRT